MAALRSDLIDAPYQLCIQKASLLTDFLEAQLRPGVGARAVQALHYRTYKRALVATALGTPQTPSQIRWQRRLMTWYARSEPDEAGMQLLYARGFAHILAHMKLCVYPHERIVGNLSSKRIGAPLHPDLGGMLMLPEIDHLDDRETNPIQVDPADRCELKERIFPFWFRRSIPAWLALYTHNATLFNQMLDGSFFVLTQFAGISHLTPDYPAVLQLGFRGIRDRYREQREEVEFLHRRNRGQADARDFERRNAFFRAGEIAAQAAMDYGRRWRDHLADLTGRCEDSERRRELEELTQIFDRIPAEPARTFHEALQSIMVTHAMVHQESFQHGISFGRLDQYLYPYYQRDREAGRLTDGEAVELLGCFLGKAAELLPLFFERATEYFSGLSSASGITLAGSTNEGEDASNPLSYLILHAYDQMRLRQPNLHVRIHPKTPPDFKRLCYQTVKKGGGMPAFFNDERIIVSQEALGFRPEDARNYAVVGCAEWGSPYNAFPAAGAVFVNLAAALEMALHNGTLGGKPFGPPTGIPEDIADLDQLVTAFRSQVENLVTVCVEGNNAIELSHGLHRPTPFLSTIVAGCSDSGRDLNVGGARYNSTGCQGVGLADVADSLAAITKLVFESGELSLGELARITTENYEGFEDLRHRILNKIPKYGEDAGCAEEMGALTARIFTEAVRAHRNPRGGPYAAGFWTMTTHQGFGRRLGAMVSGRRAGEPLANGVSPRNGFDRRGPTASLNAAAAIEAPQVANGYVLNQKLHPDFVKGNAGDQLIDGLMTGYFAKGGMQVQFNVLDPQVLIDAKQHPERYRDLVVRISGYSAYFNDLTEAMKEELITRTLHCPAHS